MHFDIVQNCVRYFEGRVGHEIRKAHKNHDKEYDKIEVNDYANYHIDKNEKIRKKRNAYIDSLLTKKKRRAR